MKQMMHARTVANAVALAVGFGLLTAGMAQAHCDTMKGPLVPEAQAALEKGDVTPILKWVDKASEAEIKAAFASAVAVRTKGPEAKALADRYFLETLVRVHRAGEGAPYTGLHDTPVPQGAAMGDKALADGSSDEMIKKLSAHMTHAVREKFDKAVEAGKHKDKSVEAGREYVEAYVTYMHYVEGLHDAITATVVHHSTATPKAAAVHEHPGAR